MGIPPPPFPVTNKDDKQDDEDSCSTTTDSLEHPDHPDDGLETGLKPVKINLWAPKGTEILEAFLK